MNALAEKMDADDIIIDGGNSSDVVYVTADWVTISGFTVKTSGVNYSTGFKY